MYFDGDGPTQATLDLPKGHYSGAWVNVRTGGVARSEEVSAGPGGAVLESPEFVNGIALRLKRVAN